MKKIVFLLSGIIIIVFLSGMLLIPKGSKPFEGTIIYVITVEGSTMSDAEKAQFPAESVITINCTFK